ncbi:MAG: bifunctional (p)ppGpp synthetase/guanosine-3',5'-bis(diphosphate) 3'-pyrophosphohydrolase, partial [Nitrospirae bacterium]
VKEDNKMASPLKEIIDRIKAYTPDIDDETIELIRKAYNYAEEAHSNQMRKEGSPYITHLIEVAKILAKMHMDPTTIIAGLLHDTIEDTNITYDDIKYVFGEEVAKLVDSLTKVSKLKFKDRQQHQAENFKKMFLSTAHDVRVIIIKFADRLHNMRTLQFLTEDKRRRIANETLELYAPLANILGIGWIKYELEDLAIKHLYPKEYAEIARKVEDKKERYEEYIEEIKQFLERQLKERGIPATITGRIKPYSSIFKKMKKKGIPFEQVHDVLGIRIITDKNEHCYSILGHIHSKWIPVPGRFKDHIGSPKPNLYQSLHTTVIGPKGEKVEFQIRTKEMERIAEEGIAAHWRYKNSLSQVVDDRRVKILRDKLKEVGTGDAKGFIENIKEELFPYHVYVFTPKGDIMELPEGSTVLDFAYYIHTNVGHHCKEGIVEGVRVPLKYTLQNGDTVEVITSKDVEPSQEWLNIAKTRKAKNKIKQWLKEVERKDSIRLGEQMLKRELDANQLILKLVELDILKITGCASIEDVYASIGYGRLSAKKLVKDLKAKEKIQKEDREKKLLARLIKMVKWQTKGPEPSIEIKGLDNRMLHRAKCCYPVPGEDIVGFLTKGRGVSIHR